MKIKYPKTLILNFDESYYDNQYLKRFIDNLNKFQFQALTVYTPNNEIVDYRKDLKVFVDHNLSKLINSKDHKIYHEFLSFSIENGFDRIIIPRIIQPEYFYSDLLYYKKCPEIILGGGAFELFIRSKARENIVKKILELEKVKKLILHTIGGKNAKFPRSLSLEQSLRRKIFVMSEAKMAPDNSYDLNKFESKKKLGIEENKFNILFFGTMFYWKGPDVLAEAINLLNDDVRCIYAGNAKTINFDWQIPKNNKFKVFNEYITESKMYSLFNAVDLVVCPYRKTYEYGSSNVLLQALLSGNPVLAPNLEPFSSIVDLYKFGELFVSENAQSLKEGIEKIIKLGTNNYVNGIRKYLINQENWNDIIDIFFN